MKIYQFKVLHTERQFVYSFYRQMAEWLGRWTVNPLGSARVGSSPIFVVFFIWFYGEMNSNLQFEFSNQSSNLRKKLLSLKPHTPPSLKFRKKQNN